MDDFDLRFSDEDELDTRLRHAIERARHRPTPALWDEIMAIQGATSKISEVRRMAKSYSKRWAQEATTLEGHRAWCECDCCRCPE